MLIFPGLPVVMAAAAAVMDLRTAKVDNGWILFCLCTGFAARILRDGPEGIRSFLLGAGIPVLLLGWLFVFRMLGPGDIKLLSVLGGLLGPEKIMKCAICSLFIGAVISAAILISNGNICQRLHYFFQYIEETVKTGKRRPYYRRGMSAPENFHFTVPVFLSVLLYAGGVY